MKTFEEFKKSYKDQGYFYENAALVYVLKSIGVDFYRIERFRGCSFRDGEVHLYTRTGGANAEDSEDSDYAESNCYLEMNPHYLRSHDDEMDNTYEDFYFSIPEEYVDEFKQFGDINLRFF